MITHIDLILSKKEHDGFVLWLKQTLVMGPNSVSSCKIDPVSVDRVLETLLSELEK